MPEARPALLNKIRKLLALSTGRNVNLHESQLAKERAEELMNRHGITDKDLNSNRAVHTHQNFRAFRAEALQILRFASQRENIIVFFKRCKEESVPYYIEIYLLNIYGQILKESQGKRIKNGLSLSIERAISITKKHHPNLLADAYFLQGVYMARLHYYQAALDCLYYSDATYSKMRRDNSARSEIKKIIAELTTSVTTQGRVPLRNLKSPVASSIKKIAFWIQVIAWGVFIYVILKARP